MRTGWLRSKIKDVCHVEYGTRVVRKRDAGTIFDVYGGGGPTFHMDEFNRESRVVIARFGISEQCTRFVEGKFFLNDSGLTLSPFDRESIHPSFLDWMTLSLNDSLYALGRGSAQKNLSVPDLREMQISYPTDVGEQLRIVAILDEAFDGISSIVSATEQNLVNARELFESRLNAVFSEGGDGWVEQPLRELTSKIGSGATPRGGQAAYKVEGISLIRSMNVHDMGFRKKALAYIDDQQAAKLSNVVIDRGDVLLNITGASVARCSVVLEEVLPARVNQHVAIVRALPKQLDAHFLHYLLISRVYKDELLGIGEEGGSTRQAITKAQIQDFVISYPNCLTRQVRIVAELDELADHTERLSALIQQKLGSLSELRQSILQKAFAGELTAEPDKALAAAGL